MNETNKYVIYKPFSNKHYFCPRCEKKGKIVEYKTGYMCLDCSAEYEKGDLVLGWVFLE